MFILDTDVVDIIVYYRKVNRNFIAHSEKSFKEDILTDVEKAKFKKLTVTMKVLSWGLFNELQEASSIYDMSASRNVFNVKKYKEEKLKMLIVKWDATSVNKEGVITPVQVSEKSILSLSPSIAEVILNSYDEISVLDADDEKK